MGINEAGQAHPAAKVDQFGSRVDEANGSVTGTDVDQVGTAHDNRLRPRLSRIPGPDRAVGE